MAVYVDAFAVEGESVITASIANLTDSETGLLATDADSTLFLTVIASGGAALATRAAMAYQQPGAWALDVAAAGWTPGTLFAWKQEQFDQTGTTGALKRTFRGTVWTQPNTVPAT